MLPSNTSPWSQVTQGRVLSRVLPLLLVFAASFFLGYWAHQRGHVADIAAACSQKNGTIPASRPSFVSAPELENKQALPGGIPLILHQSWKTSEVPARFQAWSQSWKTTNPAWHYKLWTDADNEELVRQRYPWLVAVYRGMKAIIKADTARLLYMKEFGGCYVDLDFEALKPLEGLLHNRTLALARMGNRTVEHKSHEHNVPNSFMCSAPGHEFWDYCLRVVVERSALANAFPHAKRWDSIERIAGPAMLYVALMDWRYITGEHLPIIDDAALIYPYDWTHAWSTSATPMVEDCHASDNPKFNPEKCKARFPDAYAITYWSRTWADDAPGEPPPQETAPVSNAVETADGD